MLGQQFDRNMDKLLVQKTDDQSGFAGHCRMSRVAGKEVAQNRVLGIGGAAADEVARIEVPHHNGDLFRLEVGLDSFSQKKPDVLEFDIA